MLKCDIIVAVEQERKLIGLAQRKNTNLMIVFVIRPSHGNVHQARFVILLAVP